MSWVHVRSWNEVIFHLPTDDKGFVLKDWLLGSVDSSGDFLWRFCKAHACYSKWQFTESEHWGPRGIKEFSDGSLTKGAYFKWRRWFFWLAQWNNRLILNLQSCYPIWALSWLFHIQTSFLFMASGSSTEWLKCLGSWACMETFLAPGYRSP